MKYIENENELNKLINEELVLVDYYATWCGPCQMLNPILEEISNENKNLTIVKVDVDKHEKIAKDHKVISIPTIEIYKKAKLINKIIGYHSKEELESLLK